MASLHLSRAAPDEAAQLKDAAGGRSDAVRWLLDEVAPIVHGFIWARVGGDRLVAEDLLQETLTTALAGAGGFRGESAVSTWMCGIARHLLARHWESERRAEIARSRLRVVGDDATSDGSDELARREEIAQALGRLPALQRQVLTMKYLDGLAVQEIAEQIGRTRVQVQSLLNEAGTGCGGGLGESHA